MVPINGQVLLSGCLFPGNYHPDPPFWFNFVLKVGHLFPDVFQWFNPVGNGITRPFYSIDNQAYFVTIFLDLRECILIWSNQANLVSGMNT
jgi:hypothetical protein